jgi:putative ATPase
MHAVFAPDALAGEEHFNLISALHKSLRDSDPQAALYWMCRMLAAGDDPLYVARRLIRFASEDVGLAVCGPHEQRPCAILMCNQDPHALSLAVAAFQAYHQLGSPEGELSLANCCVYLATAPKSNSVYTAYQKVMEEVPVLSVLAPLAVVHEDFQIQKSGSLPPPLVIRNAPTRLMKDLARDL